MKKLTRFILSEFGGEVVKREELEKVFNKFRESAEKNINFMISYGYLVRVLRGLYYVKTLDEFTYVGTLTPKSQQPFCRALGNAGRWEGAGGEITP